MQKKKNLELIFYLVIKGLKQFNIVKGKGNTIMEQKNLQRNKAPCS